MPKLVRFRCNNCGHRFEEEELTDEEKREAERERRPTSPIRCPNCKRIDFRRGWE